MVFLQWGPWTHFDRYEIFDHISTEQNFQCYFFKKNPTPKSFRFPFMIEWQRYVEKQSGENEDLKA